MQHPIVSKMLEKDAYSNWLGVERIHEAPGECEIKMTVKPLMLNGFSIAHGAITYALADSALAFAANSHGRLAVSVETSISHLQPVFENDTLIAKAKEISMSEKIGIYEVDITNQHEVLVAKFKGTVYLKKDVWEV